MTYTSEAEIARIGTRFADLTLPKAEWTHAAHFAATVWLLRCRPEVIATRDMPDMIRRYNIATGGVNSDSAGYHETITQASIRATQAFLATCPAVMPLHLAHAALMAGACEDKGWLFAHWSRDTLMSAQARQAWMEPDIAPLPF